MLADLTDTAIRTNLRWSRLIPRCEPGITPEPVGVPETTATMSPREAALTRCLRILLGEPPAATAVNFAADFDCLDAADQAAIAAILQAAATRTQADEDAGMAILGDIH